MLTLHISSVIIASAFQIGYTTRLFESDYSLRAFPFYLSMQLVQFLSIATACLVYFLPFLRSLQSGLLWAHNTTAYTSNYSLSHITRQPRARLLRTNETIPPSTKFDRRYVETRTENVVVTKSRSQDSETGRPPLTCPDLYCSNL